MDSGHGKHAQPWQRRKRRGRRGAVGPRCGMDAWEGRNLERTGEGAAALLRLGGAEEQQEHRRAAWEERRCDCGLARGREHSNLARALTHGGKRVAMAD